MFIYCYGTQPRGISLRRAMMSGQSASNRRTGGKINDKNHAIDNILGLRNKAEDRTECESVNDSLASGKNT